MSLLIHPASPTDAPLLALLGRVTFREAFAPIFANYLDDLRDYLARTFAPRKIAASLAKPANRFWIATLDTLPIGYAKTKHPSPAPHELPNDAAQLQKIYVLAEFHGSGAGAALLDAATHAAAAAGAPCLWLTVLATNTPALRFYARHSWRDSGATQHQIGAQTLAYRLLARDL